MPNLGDDRAAPESHNGADEYVRHLVESYVDHDTWFRQQVRVGLGQLDQGKFLTDEEMAARVEKMLRP